MFEADILLFFKRSSWADKTVLTSSLVQYFWIAIRSEVDTVSMDIVQCILLLSFSIMEEMARRKCRISCRMMETDCCA